jgi:hypothetical protein
MRVLLVMALRTFKRLWLLVAGLAQKSAARTSARRFEEVSQPCRSRNQSMRPGSLAEATYRS